MMIITRNNPRNKRKKRGTDLDSNMNDGFRIAEE